MSSTSHSRSIQSQTSRTVKATSSSTDGAKSSCDITPIDDLDDEWWNDDESLISIPAKAHAASSRVTRWPAIGDSQPKAISKRVQSSIRRSVKSNSVYKPTRDKSKQRQKKQNARAGIKVNTNVSRYNGSAPVIVQLPASEPSRQPGCFVDLAALQALDSQIPTNGPGFWRSFGGKQSDSEPSIEAKLQDVETGDTEVGPASSRGFGSRRNNALRPPSLNIGDELSPSDRPIFIGISIPSASLAQHVTSPQTALSETSNIIETYENRSPGTEGPESPTILITPAQEPSMWSALGNDSNSTLPRTTTETVPTAPQIPSIPSVSVSQRMKQANKAGKISTDIKYSTNRHSTRSRSNSAGTVFEDDDSPIAIRKQHAGSEIDLGITRRRMSESTVIENRRSKGWWNHIISPFLTRSNTVVFPNSSMEEHPPMPSLATAAIEAQRAIQDQKWEKGLSPTTPTSSTTIASDAWWDNRRTIDGMPKVSDIPNSANGTYRSEDYGTLPFMLSTEDGSDAINTSVTLIANNVSNDSRLRRDQAANPTSRDPAPTHPDREEPLMSTEVVNNAASASENQNSTVENNPDLDGAEVLRRNIRDQTRLASGEMVETRSQPPPYSPPRSNFRPYRALYPPGLGRNLQPPHSPGPVSPGLQQAISSRGGIALTEVPLTPAAPRRLINLNSGYPTMSSRQEYPDENPVALAKAAKKARKLEAKRRRREREDAMAHKAGGLWRGRGCIPDSGCYGRAGTEGRKRRRCWFGLIAGILTLLILIAVLATQLHRPSTNSAVVESQWLNLTIFPPIFTGISTVAVPKNTVANSGCVAPTTAWSCALPKELQDSVAPNQPNQPNFRMQIQWDNSSATNASLGIVSRMDSPVGNSVSARRYIKSLGLKARSVLTFNPSPPPPSAAEQFFLGNTTDGIMSKNKAGEPTPFYITFLSTTSPVTLSNKLLKRQDSNSTSQFPNATALIPGPSSNADGTAAPANLLPFPVQQPIRLYDRGLPTEHYGFYNYFDRSIFLKSTKGLDPSPDDNGVVPDDQNGGSTLSEAFVRCTWAQTRFLVQIWTRKGASAALFNATLPFGSTATSPTTNQTANNFSRPGSFPYPVTITTDRHGGDIQRKVVYCYELDGREQLIPSTAQQLGESRSVGGTIINAAPSLSSDQSDPNLGGFDGGTSGCSCSWTNFINVIGNV